MMSSIGNMLYSSKDEYIGTWKNGKKMEKVFISGVMDVYMQVNLKVERWKGTVFAIIVKGSTL